MKILISANSGWNIKNFRENLIKELLNLGHDVIIAAPKDDYIDQVIGWGCSYCRTEFSGRTVNPFSELYLFILILKIVIREKPDIICSFTIKPNIYFSLVARILNIPSVCNITGMGKAFLRSDLQSNLIKSLLKFAIKKVEYCFFHNDHDLNHFVTHGFVQPCQAIKVAGSGIDLKKFNRKKKL